MDTSLQPLLANLDVKENIIFLVALVSFRQLQPTTITSRVAR